MFNEELPSKLNVLLKDLEDVLSRIDYGYSYQSILDKYKCNNCFKLLHLVYVRLIRDYSNSESWVPLLLGFRFRLQIL